MAHRAREGRERRLGQVPKINEPTMEAVRNVPLFVSEYIGKMQVEAICKLVQETVRDEDLIKPMIRMKDADGTPR